eukprot:3868147-Rhodomonas_salina.1
MGSRESVASSLRAETVCSANAMLEVNVSGDHGQIGGKPLARGSNWCSAVDSTARRGPYAISFRMRGSRRHFRARLIAVKADSRVRKA